MDRFGCVGRVYWHCWNYISHWFQLAEILLEKEVLNYEDIVAVLGPLPHNKTAKTHLELQDMW